MTRLVLVFCLLAAVGRAQSTTATIYGTIRDTSGAPVPSVLVEVRAVATNQTRAVTTDETGAYLITNLPIGEYEVTIKMEGFQREVRQGIVLQVQQRALLDVTLNVGAVVESIEVTTQAPLLNTGDATTGDVIDNQRVVELPLNGRNFNSLAVLTPNVQSGIAGGATLQNFLAGGIGVWAHGQRDQDNEWNLDGATMNIGFYNWGSFNPSIDAIQEFKIQTGTLSAEFGFQAGANINIVTKSGSNEIHGTAFNFLRNDKMDARGFFPTSKPKLRQNQFGGTLGGPVYIPGLYNGRDKTFFFSNYEGLRIRQSAFGNLIVPSEAQRRGDFSRTSAGAPFTGVIRDPATGQPFSNNVIPASRFARQVQAILSYYPAETVPGTLFNYQVLAPVNTNSDSTIHKVDHRLSDRDSLFGRFAYDNRDRPDPEFFPGFFRYTGLKAYNVIGNWTRTWTPSVIHDLKLAYNRSYVVQSDPRENTDFSVEGDLGIPGVPASGQTNGFPFFSIQGFAALGDNPNNPLLQPDEVYQLAYNLTINRSKHHLKMGLDHRWVRSERLQGLYVRSQFNFVNSNPVGTGHAFADFLLGLPQATRVATNPLEPRLRQRRAALYFLDDWHVTPRLTLNLGLRYEPTTPLWDVRGASTGFDFVNGQPIPVEPGEYLYPSDWNNFAPRFSFAWRPLQGDRIVLRGGYGVYYNSSINLVFSLPASNPPWVTTTDYFANPASPPITFDAPFPQGSAGTPPPANYQAATRDFGVGYSQVRTLNLQYQLTENDMIELGYMGSFTLGQDRGVETNLAPPAPGPVQPRRRLPQYGSLRELRSDAKVFYNGASAKYVRRLSRGVTAQSSFTWSRAIDQSFGALAGPPNGGTDPQSYANLSTRGLSASDRKFVWVSNAIWEMPWNPRGWAGVLLGGWQLSTISTLSSGGPFSVVIRAGPARINTGGTQRPFRIRDGNLPSGERTIQRWFDTGAFVAPPLYTFGNSESLSVIMPGLINFDFGLKKAFLIKERMRLEYRAEFFNAFNHTNFGRPGVVLDDADFGVISSAGPARVLQMGLKIVF